MPEIGARRAPPDRAYRYNALPGSGRVLRMNRQSQDPAQIVDLTLEHYNQRAREFRDATRDHDVSQNIGALLHHIEADPPYRILDFGCGPGRDLRTFAAHGHVAIGLEGAAEFVTMARADSGCEVWQQEFFPLHL